MLLSLSQLMPEEERRPRRFRRKVLLHGSYNKRKTGCRGLCRVMAPGLRCSRCRKHRKEKKQHFEVCPTRGWAHQRRNGVATVGQCRRARVVEGIDRKPIVISRAGSCPANDAIRQNVPERKPQDCRCREALSSWFTVSRSSLRWLAA